VTHKKAALVGSGCHHFGDGHPGNLGPNLGEDVEAGGQLPVARKIVTGELI